MNEETRHADDLDPWAMQIVAHIPSALRPTTSDLCAATAWAVVCFLEDTSVAGGEAQERVERWNNGRIRKLVRRARGSAWDRLQGDEGRTYEYLGVQVRVYPPGPKSELRPELSRLQVEGLSLEHPDPLGEVPAPSDGVTVVMNPEWGLERFPGKSAAQVAHATQVALSQMDEARRQRFFTAAVPLRVVWPSAKEWRDLRAGASVVIRDAGFTVLPRPGETALALW